ncbi:MAG TPA: hypothetical protein VG935_01040 [Patescibacteria group bacterium]|nr:hypothetical protein [Patescibacteria group bacterium]
MNKLLVGFLIISVIAEGILTSLPLVLISLILFTIRTRNHDVFFYAFISGIFLDILHVRPIGETSIFFAIVLLLIFLYERKFEISSLLFALLATLVSTSFYLLIFQVPGSLIQIIFSVLVAGLIFSLSDMSFIRDKSAENL